MRLGGYESIEELAEATNLLSGKTLRRSANDTRGLEPHEAEAIARVCGLSTKFFTVDFDRLTELSEPAEHPESLEERLAWLELQVKAVDWAAIRRLTEEPGRDEDARGGQQP